MVRRHFEEGAHSAGIAEPDIYRRFINPPAAGTSWPEDALFSGCPRPQLDWSGFGAGVHGRSILSHPG
jgi:hypothetical protein